MARQTAQDFGAVAQGLPAEILQADRQNKPDVGVNVARQWPCGDFSDPPPLASAAAARMPFGQPPADAGHDSGANHRHRREAVGTGIGARGVPAMPAQFGSAASVLANGNTVMGRVWANMRDDRPLPGRCRRWRCSATRAAARRSARADIQWGKPGSCKRGHQRCRLLRLRLALPGHGGLRRMRAEGARGGRTGG